ncbi:MAG: peptide-methionine (R)-S-oxide reductase MsrB [Bacteroidota bacterium]
MIRIALLTTATALSLSMTACAQSGDKTAVTPTSKSTSKASTAIEKVVKTDAEWKKILTPEQYHITREAGTERPGTSALLHNKEHGIYACVGCSLPLFESKTKFDSGTGWPSFWAPISKPNVLVAIDNSFGSTREEVLCARCNAHLGHVFEDGPQPTGLRYCMNGVALKFAKK